MIMAGTLFCFVILFLNKVWHIETMVLCGWFFFWCRTTLFFKLIGLMALWFLGVSFKRKFKPKKNNFLWGCEPRRSDPKRFISSINF